MRVAIFADIHGKILLPFKLVDLYQTVTRNKIDWILQCGDMGAFPDLKKLDETTIRHAQYNRDELRFHDDFTTFNPQISAFLDKLNLNLICVRGNHEDHDYLDELENAHPTASLFPIDVYQKVWVCKSGFRQELRMDDQTLSFVGIGRIGDVKERTDKKFIQAYEKREIKKLYKSKDNIDMLISHDKAEGSRRGNGMKELQALLDEVVFHYHFYGHTGEPFLQETAYNGLTQSVKIKELEFDENGALPPGCMVILEKHAAQELKLEIVGQELTNQLTKHHWKYM